MKRNLSTVLLCLAFFAGLILLLYPTVSNYWNARYATKAISSYMEQVTELDEERYEQLRQEAEGYNERLRLSGNGCRLSEEQEREYESLLNLSGDGVMGYLEIETLHVSLPIYHGTGEQVLQTAVGHLEWTSLPVGGESTHCVLSGHRGLPSARLFTDLDRLQEGDTFALHMLGEVLIYEVDQIRIVEPQLVDDLQITEGEDYCTLLTCTPYGINTHRLLVRGHRVDTARELHVRVVSEAIALDPLSVAPAVGIPLLLLLLVLLLLRKPTEKGKKGKQGEGGK